MRRCWKEPHHARVCIQADKWLNVARLPPAENQAIGLNYHARGPGTEVIWAEYNIPLSVENLDQLCRTGIGLERLGTSLGTIVTVYTVRALNSG